MIKEFFDKVRPHVEEGGKFHAFRSLFDGFETFALVPNTTSKTGVAIHDAIDSKRIMSFVVIALLPALLVGMYNIGYQNYTRAGVEASCLVMFAYGLAVMIPKIVVSYVVGLGIEFVVAQWKNEEIQEGYLVSGMLIPMIVPVATPLWMLAVAVAFSVVFAKEIFGGTGMNIFNPALVARAFLFFAWPTWMSGDKVWVNTSSFLGLGCDIQNPDALTCATPLGEAAAGIAPTVSPMEMMCGLMPGSIGETSVIAIAIGAAILLLTRIASWKTMGSVFVGGALMALLFDAVGSADNMVAHLGINHLWLGGFCFGAVFMATDPVTSCRTEKGKYIYGFLIGVLAITIRVLNPGYPEGMMLAILFMNMFAPLIDYCFVQRNINKRAKRTANR